MFAMLEVIDNFLILIRWVSDWGITDAPFSHQNVIDGYRGIPRYRLRWAERRHRGTVDRESDAGTLINQHVKNLIAHQFPRDTRGALKGKV